MSGSYLILIIASIALLLSGPNSGLYSMISPHTKSATIRPRASTAGVSSDIILSDGEKKKITLEVLENTAEVYRATYESNKATERTAGCLSLTQARDLVEAAAVFADSEGKERLFAKNLSISGEIDAYCIQPTPTPMPTSGGGIGGGSPDNSPKGTFVVEGGCVNGMVAALFALDEADRRAYVQRANIDIDLDALSRADRILLNITPDKRSGAAGLPSQTILADCPEGPSGTKGLVNSLILSSYLMTDPERDILVKQFRPWIPPKFDFPQPLPKKPNGFVLPKPTRTISLSDTQYRFGP